jgi:signal transduction histidine kinase
MVSDADFEATARKRRVSMLRDEPCRVVGDRELLREAIENILRNAIRYTPEGTAVTVDAYRDGSRGIGSSFGTLDRACPSSASARFLSHFAAPRSAAIRMHRVVASGWLSPNGRSVSMAELPS